MSVAVAPNARRVPISRVRSFVAIQVTETIPRPDTARALAAIHRKKIEAIGLPWYGWHGFRRGIASNLYALGADDKVVQRVLRHAKPHVTKERYIKVFDPAVLEAMRRMQATLEELRRGQQKASSILSFDGKLLKPNRGEVAERLNAAVC